MLELEPSDVKPPQLRDLGVLLVAADAGVDDLGQGEKPDQDRNEVEPGHKVCRAEGETLGAVDEVESHGGEEQAEARRDQAGQ